MFVTREDLRLPDSSCSRPGSSGRLAVGDDLRKFASKFFQFEHLAANQSKFASLSFASLSGASVEGSVEPKTGSVFPARFCHLVKRNCPVLTGVGWVSKVASFDLFAVKTDALTRVYLSSQILNCNEGGCHVAGCEISAYWE